MNPIEILHKHCTRKNVSGNIEYYKDDIIIAMEEYKATNDSTAVIKEILEFIYNYGVLDAQPQDEVESHLHQICSALHSQIKNKFLAVRDL